MKKQFLIGVMLMLPAAMAVAHPGHGAHSGMEAWHPWFAIEHGVLLGVLVGVGGLLLRRYRGISWLRRGRRG